MEIDHKGEAGYCRHEIWVEGGESCGACDIETEIAALESRVRELEAENGRLREALGPFVAGGIELACDECGGDDTECPEDCAVRIGRAALKGEG